MSMRSGGLGKNPIFRPDMKHVLICPLLSLAVLLPACHSPSGNLRQPGKDTTVVDLHQPHLPAFQHNPEFRDQIKKTPVAEYHEKTGNIAGDFSVRLYQTSKTMYFRVDIEWEGLPGSDTVKLPDIGKPPRPVLQKGSEKSSCIVGFLDNDNRFREQKLIHTKGDQLKITTLRHWMVTDSYRLVAE